MTPDQAIAAVYEGNMVECSTEDYPTIRRALQDKVGQWIDQGRTASAIIALDEVKRLDALHNFVMA